MIIFLFLFWSQFSSADELGFDRALSEMVDTNIDVRVQQTKASASESQIWSARGAFGPSVSLVGQQQNGGGSNYSYTTGSQNLSDGQVYAATVTWNVYRSGADLAGLNAALSDRNYQYAQLDELRLEAEAKAAQALLDLIENKMAVEVYRRSEDNARRFLTIAEERFNRSLLSHEEMDKVALDAANAEARRADAETLFNATRSTVESLLGHSSIQLSWPWEKLFVAIPKEMTWASGTALEQRPDMRAAQTALLEDSDKSKSLFRTMFPTFDLNYSRSVEVFSGQSMNGWATTATLTIPLWNGYHDYANYQTQVAAKYASEARVHQLQRTVEGVIHTAQDNFKLAFDQYKSRLKNLAIAKHIMDQDGARFKAGRADANELTLDLSRVTDAEILAIQGIEQAHIAYMNLKHAFGERVQ